MLHVTYYGRALKSLMATIIAEKWSSNPAGGKKIIGSFHVLGLLQ
jgi:hypothetical protein